MKNHVKHLVLAAGFGLCAAATGFAQSTLTLAQYDFNQGIPVASWAWQSITVPEAANLTTFGFEWNGSTGDMTATARVDVLTGEGLGGTLVASAAGSVVPVTEGPLQGFNFFTADFGNLPLSAGQYTLYVHDPSAQLDLLYTDAEVYSGGKFGSDFTGDTSGAATFVTPVPIPEPSMLALLGLGAAGLFIARRRKRTRKHAA